MAGPPAAWTCNFQTAFMALTWEYYPSSLMTNVEDDGLACLWLKQPVVLEWRANAITEKLGASGQSFLQPALEAVTTNWKQTCHFKKRGGIHQWLFAEMTWVLLIITKAAINGEHSKCSIVMISNPPYSPTRGGEVRVLLYQFFR